MKQFNYFKFSVFALAMNGFAAMAQDTNVDKHTIDIKIPEVAILDLETTGKSSAISLAAEAPKEAGNALDFTNAVNTEIWINYSSIIGSKTEPSREVTVQITSGDVPSGMEISVEAAKDAGLGEGTVGSPAGVLSLSTSAQKIITGVGSAYTGDGAKSGHNLTYKLKAASGAYGDIDFDQSGSITVTYTLSDN
ncbi:hypothetical protein EGI22_08175 [Lacihabitans sp. LS3-19]|uniref:hypothetical protein n=1 Tax=Lacihabitans sp. LS3-19 TaxID=2487335 RepID=UPI0020CC3BF3|nr:hypothetical protein [Lacihabitans sp. LS3-19]MCP9767886.1 hypothetical protein [Lacihabitans sp. LS3-19]